MITEPVNHGMKEYARGDVTTNTVEGFFGIFKRGMSEYASTAASNICNGIWMNSAAPGAATRHHHRH
jgi:hypothetical protein